MIDVRCGIHILTPLIPVFTGGKGQCLRISAPGRFHHSSKYLHIIDEIHVLEFSSFSQIEFLKLRGLYVKVLAPPNRV